jgi:hypothetical protein
VFLHLTGLRALRRDTGAESKQDSEAASALFAGSRGGVTSRRKYCRVLVLRSVDSFPVALRKLFAVATQAAAKTGLDALRGWNSHSALDEQTPFGKRSKAGSASCASACRSL